MELEDHLRTTGGALKNWFIAQCQDAVAVGLLWLAGLWAIGVPWAPLWAVIGGLCQFIPNIGAVLALLGPALAAGLKAFGDANWMRFVYVLILYAAIVAVDGLLLQPWLMKRTTKVPIWASILAPIVFGLVMGPWGVLLAPPLLAVVYTYKRAVVSRKL
jgi:predicted PurR-regulated permease PerM